MENLEKTREILIAHYKKYPRMQIQDLLKFLHQSAYGCAHLVSSLEKALDYIRTEAESNSQDIADWIEPLDGAYSRVHLSCLNRGVEAERLAEFFFLSAKDEPSGKKELLEKIEVAKELIRQKKLPFSEADFEKALIAWEADGFSVMRHSEEFRESYKPAYRVIANSYVPILRSFAK